LAKDIARNHLNDCYLLSLVGLLKYDIPETGRVSLYGPHQILPLDTGGRIVSYFALKVANGLFLNPIVACSYVPCFQSRGSRNPMTGPTSDNSREKTGGGGYTFIDSSFPRRPGDLARLSSSIFSPTGTNLVCLKY